MLELKSYIAQEASLLGFSKIGFAKAEEPAEEVLRLGNWLRRGFHGTMEWMARNLDKRRDPGKLLTHAKTILVVALNYYTDVAHGGDNSRGKISRYAWGDDYHDIIKARLNLLLSRIKLREPHAEGKTFVDTGPVLEKVWAQRAGIGWEGKHTNVITREFGSWVFLGEIILDIEVEYDTPAADRCGKCTLCIQACPTRAIIAPYVLDASLCISYLTIEYRGEMPAKLADKFENWVFGCDICQDVCPWNRKFAVRSSMSEFYPRPYNVSPPLEDLAKMSDEEFRRKFYKSAVKRRKKSGIVRNASFILGNNPINP